MALSTAESGIADHRVDRRVAVGFRIVALLIGGWLLAAALLVNVEYGDGYSAVANAEYFLGSSSVYFWQRGPLMSLLLVPGEWIAQWLQLPAMDVRPHHAIMALLHFLYLLGVWRLLTARFSIGAATLLAFVAAVPTLVFFSYAPFISHDILPGLLALYLLVVCNRFARKPSLSTWMLFLGLSLALVLVKQTYAIVPLAVLLGRLVAAVFERQTWGREAVRIGLLAGAAALAGLASWIVYALLASDRFPDVPFMLRPWSLINRIGMNYEGLAELQDLYYQWLYLRNASAYGTLAMTLVVPGIVLAFWRGDALLRQVAATLLVLLVLMHLTLFKEVRYLAFLAPLVAFVTVPVFAHVLQGPARYRWLLGLVLLVDMARIAPEALRIRFPYYQNGITSFFAPLSTSGDPGVPVFFGVGWLSFVSPDRDAYYGDAFHRITEMHVEQVRVLHGWEREKVFRIKLSAVAAAMQRHPESMFLLQNVLLSRAAPYRPGNLAGLPPDFVQTLSRVETVEFVREGDRYVVGQRPEMPRMLVRDSGVDGEMSIVMDGVEPEVLRHFGGFDGLPDRVSMKVLAVLRLCQLDGCRSYGD